ncbi:MAG: hypothetical protein H5T83_00680 [Actinotalea sp.]|nr:hypothetical protein [Actinotalea sp.]
MDEQSSSAEARATVQGLGTYLNDHLAGSVAGSERFARLADALSATPVGPEVARVAREVAQERDELREIIEVLGLRPQNHLKQATAWVGEHVARLKASRRSLRRRRTDALLEVELLRSALVGKLGGWQVLEDLAPDLGLDRARMAELRARTLEQVATMDEVHAAVRSRVLRAVS